MISVTFNLIQIAFCCFVMAWMIGRTMPDWRTARWIANGFWAAALLLVLTILWRVIWRPE